ncbi:MAG: hypothetical protein QG640_213 [Patescibacteria group bacterium]|nr:hypothetical protein [Patescibacteria group bacterium]
MHRLLKNEKGGYTLLFAVLVSSIVLSIGISILTISRKEFLLSASARDSTSAFYAADSGLECAAYHDGAGDYFSTTTPDVVSISCAEYSPTESWTFDLLADDGGLFVFSMPLGTSGSCAVVSVEKYFDDDDIATTRIISRGYNVGWDDVAKSCSEPSSRRVERALQLTY